MDRSPKQLASILKLIRSRVSRLTETLNVAKAKAKEYETRLKAAKAVEAAKPPKPAKKKPGRPKKAAN